MSPLTLLRDAQVPGKEIGEIGELSRHWLRWRAERKCAKATARLQGPPTGFGYRVVQRDGYHVVIAYQDPTAVDA